MILNTPQNTILIDNDYHYHSNNRLKTLIESSGGPHFGPILGYLLLCNFYHIYNIIDIFYSRENTLIDTPPTLNNSQKGLVDNHYHYGENLK